MSIKAMMRKESTELGAESYSAFSGDLMDLHQSNSLGGQILRPRCLYEEETKAKFGEFIGILGRTFMFWEVADKAVNGTDITDSWENEYASQKAGYFIVGRDKKHAHPTAVYIYKDAADREKILRLLGSDEDIYKNNPKRGFLILGSRPPFLSAGPHRPVYLVAGQTNLLPPYRVVFPSFSVRGWEMTTIGGIFEADGHMYSVIIQPTDDRTTAISAEGSKGKAAYGKGASAESATSALSRSTSKWIPASAFIPGKQFGHMGEHPCKNDTCSWFLVELEDDIPILNTIPVPNGFGDTFTLTEVGEPVHDREVWIATSSCGVQVGRITYLYKEQESIGGDKDLWAVQMDTKLASEDCGSWVIDALSRSLVGIIMDESALFYPSKMIIESLGNSKISLPQPKRASTPPKHATTPPKRAYRHQATQGREHALVQPHSSPSFLATLLYCCLRVRKHKMENNLSSTSFGGRLGTTDGQKVWELGEDIQKEWQTLEPQIEDLVRRTPPKSKSMPTIILHGLLVGKTKNQAVPTILISSSSMAYATQLRKVIQQNGTLNTTDFRVMTLNSPIDTSIPESSRVTRSRQGRESLV